MSNRKRSPYPEIYCDFNARMTERGFSLERNGSVKDLERLGLTLESVIGQQFVFYMEDADDSGNPDDIMFDGIVIFSKEYGYLAIMTAGTDFYWRSNVEVGNESK